ncbi:MAG: glycosyltransferase family 39 protein [Pseudomonadota bacterium]
MTMNDTSKTSLAQDALALGGIMALAAALAVPLVLRNPNLGSDSLRCLVPIHNFMAGHGYTMTGQVHLTYPPGFGILAYLVFGLCQDVELSGMIVNLASYLLLPPLLYACGRQSFGRRAGLLAAFFAAIGPYYLKYSWVNFTDLPFAVFLLLSLYLCLRLLEAGPRPWRGLLLGLSLGYAYLVRPEGFQIAGLVLAGLGLLALLAWRGRAGAPPSWPRDKKVLLTPLWVALAFALLAAPYVLFLHEHTGRWTISTKFRQTLIVYGEGVVDGFDTAVKERRERSPLLDESMPLSMIDYIHQRGWKFAQRVAINLLNEARYLVKMGFQAVVPALLLGLWLLIRRWGVARSGPWLTPRGLRLAGVFLVFMSPLAGLLIFYISDRFLLGYTLISLLLLAALNARLLERLLPPARQGLGLALVALLGVLSVSGLGQALWPGLPRLLRPPLALSQVLAERHANAGVRAAGLWLAGQGIGQRDFVVAGVKKLETFIFYARGQDPDARLRVATLTSSSSLEETAGLLRSGRADFLLLDEHYVASYPALLRLWQDPGLAPGLGLELWHADAGGRFMLFRAAGRQLPLGKADKKT